MSRWLGKTGHKRGEVVTLDQMWKLAKAWYGSDPRSKAWRPRSRDESQAVMESVGLTGSFWQLPG